MALLLSCSGCGEIKIEEQFHFTSKSKHRRANPRARKDFRNYRSSRCKVCAAKKTAAWFERNASRLDELKVKYALAGIKSGARCFKASIHRARSFGVRIDLSLAEWQEVHFGTTCHWCGMALHRSFTHVDHIVPLSQGGEHTRSNLVSSCANCNMRRSWERKIKFDASHYEARMNPAPAPGSPPSTASAGSVTEAVSGPSPQPKEN